MELILPKEQCSVQFTKLIRRRLQLELLSNIISSYPSFEQYTQLEFNEPINVYELLKQSINNLIIYETQKEYILKINPLIKYKNTNLTLELLCCMLNNGTLQFKGIELFTKCINKVSSKLDYYKKLYRPIYML